MISDVVAIEPVDWLTVVMFYRDGCPCIKTREQLESAASYFTRSDLRVMFCVVDADIPETEDLVDEYDVDTTPRIVFLYLGDWFSTLDGYQNKHRIINAVYEAMNEIKNATGVML